RRSRRLRQNGARDVALVFVGPAQVGPACCATAKLLHRQLARRRAPHQGNLRPRSFRHSAANRRESFSHVERNGRLLSGAVALETVEEGKTGVFFDQPDSRTLATAIEKFESLKWDQYTLRWHAEKFDRTVFAFRVLQFLGSVAPASCAEELLAGARLLSQNIS